MFALSFSTGGHDAQGNRAWVNDIIDLFIEDMTSPTASERRENKELRKMGVEVRGRAS